MKHRAAKPTVAEGARGAWRSLLALVGLGLMGAGVALNEGGAAMGLTLIVVGLPLSVLALLLSVFDRGRARPLPAASDEPATPNARKLLAELARARFFEARPGRIDGRLKGKQVRAEAKHPEGPIEVRALTTRALDVGLSVTCDGGPGDARPPIRVGQTSFDEAFTVRADEPERARAIITPRLRALLLELCSMKARLDDSGVELTVPATDRQALYDALRQAARAVGELERAGGGVPCAKALRADREAWLAFAHEHKLASADTPLAMWGRMDGMAVSAVAVRDAFRQYHFELSCEFSRPLERGLELRPASSSNQLDRSGEPVGHPAFDKVFVLKAREPLAAARLVGGETRTALIELRNLGLQLRLRDRGLWAWLAFDAQRVDRTAVGLGRMALIGARIRDNDERYAAPRPSAARRRAAAEATDDATEA